MLSPSLSDDLLREGNLWQRYDIWGWMAIVMQLKFPRQKQDKNKGENVGVRCIFEYDKNAVIHIFYISNK